MLQQSPSTVSSTPQIGVRSPSALMAMPEIARHLTIEMECPATIIDKIRLLNRQYGFPAPKTLRFRKGKLVNGPRAIIWKSKFDRRLVLAWLDNHFSPPDAAPPIGNPDTARRLAERAKHKLANAA